MNIAFSVLASIYYKESPAYFNSCMQSIWYEQILKPNEIILVKDGLLTSELDDLIKKWQYELKGVLIVIPLKQNVGLGKALNIGLSYCTHEWVFRMDTDDICVPERFAKQVAFIIDNPETDIVSGQVLEFDDTIENVTGTKSVPITHLEILKYSKLRSPFNHMAVAYKKSVIQSVGGYQHHMYMEDYNLWLRLLAADYKSANLKDLLVMVRGGEDMIKRRRGKVYIKSEWQLFKLKQNLNYQSNPQALCIFIVRSFPRLLPTYVLIKLYTKLRKYKY